MCGIVGYCGEGLDRREAVGILAQMNRTQHHRGPEQANSIIFERAGLGHTRLSIIGLADGNQPMSDPSGRYTLTFNGEIFNYVEIRQELEQKGHIFHTSSDSEVLLQSLIIYGKKALERLNGDFAFALWDQEEKTMLLARDRMGVRPLFHTQKNGNLYFASEIKALLQCPGVDARMDPKALDQIFTLWAPIAPRTCFEDIHELQSGHCLTVKLNSHDLTLHEQVYWTQSYPNWRHQQQDRGVSFAQTCEELDALLTDATRIRMRADVPVGSYLSGGLDSSLITALAAPFAARDGLQTFSIAFESKDHDESAFQHIMTRFLSTNHSQFSCKRTNIVSNLPDVITATEKPIIRTAPTPLFTLSNLVRDKGLKVVLTGEGADEVFAGYDIFREAKTRRFCARQPASRFRPLLFSRLYPYMKDLNKQSPDYLAAFFGIKKDNLNDPLYSHQPRMRSTSAAKIFFSAELKAQLAGYSATQELLEQLPEEFGDWHPLNQAQYLETRYLLPGYILSSQGDRMAMAHSVEGRFPFLDHRIVEFASQLPISFKLNGLTEKYILRKMAEKYVPKEILDRPKQPYRAPDSQAFQTAFSSLSSQQDCESHDYVARMMGEQAIAQAGWFNPKAVAKLTQKCAKGATASFRDNTAFIGILTSQLWRERFESTHKIQQTSDM